MTIVIGFLTFFLALISLFVILLVLVQLPKKEAGVGMAFGAGMSEMLLGAGSGNVLTRITKYVVGTFLTVSLLLSVMISHHHRAQNQGVTRALEEQANAVPAPSANQPPAAPAGSSLQPLSLSNAPATPVPAAAAPATPAPNVISITSGTPAKVSAPAVAPAPAPTPATATPAAKAPTTPAAAAPAPAGATKPAGN